MLDRHAIAAALREIGALLQLQGGRRFQARAYDRAGAALAAWHGGDDALGDEQRLCELPGIGAGLARTIVDLRRRGRTPVLDHLRAELPRGVLQLRQVPHLTVRRIRLLQAALGIADVDALEAACRDGRVRAVRGFGDKTVAQLLAGIDAWRQRGDDVLLFAADRDAAPLLAFAKSLPGVRDAALAGGVRRRTELVDAIDLVLAADDPAAALVRCERHAAVVAVTENGATRRGLRLANGTSVRVHAATPDEFGALLLRTTGSAEHVAHVERLTRDGSRGDRAGGAATPAPRRDEAACYARAGLPFVPPELREGAGEIEAALAGELPELLRRDDVRGLVHCHTVFSDGRHTIEAMARAADAMGMEYLTITDHSPTAHYANGVEPERLRAQWDEIDRVQELVRVRLLRGTECDILADGSLDYDDSILARLDVVIASVHNRHRMDHEQMTARLIAAMRHPVFKIWGHPLGRYVGSRPPIDCDVEAVLDAAAESRVAIEINGDPHRLDLEPRWQRAASARGIPFVVSTDAHSVGQLHNLDYGVDMARRGWLTAAHVLNCRGADAFRAAVRPS